MAEISATKQGDHNVTNTAEPTAREAKIGDNVDGVNVLAMVKEEPRVAIRDAATRKKLYDELDRIVDEASTDISTSKGRDAVRKQTMDIVRLRTALDAAGKDMTEEWRKQTKEVNEVRAEIKAELEQREERLRAPLTAWEDAEKAREEKVRAYRELLENSRKVPAGVTPERILKQREKVEAVTVDEATFGDLVEKVTEERDEAIKALDAAHKAALQAIADAEELEKLRAEKIARDRADEQRRRDEAAAEEKRLAAERAEAERQEAVAAAAREAEERVKREAAEAAEAAERQRQADEAEIHRKAQEAIDAANERARLAEEAAQRERDENARREREAEEVRKAQAAENERRRKDQEHRQAIFEQTAQDITGVGGITMAAAKKLVQAMAAGSIRNVKVEF